MTTRSFLLVFALVLATACAADQATDPADDSPRGNLGGKADALSGSCETPETNFCGGQSETGNCHCDDKCSSFGDCCSDAAPVCGVESNRLENRIAGKSPLLSSSELERVIDLPNPAGNVAVNEAGRVFFSFHPEGNTTDVHIAEVIGGGFEPFPSREFQDRLNSVLSLRVGPDDRLWLLDYGTMGIRRPKLYAIDIATREVVFEYKFTNSAAPFGSFLNDFHIAPDGKTIYISDTSAIKGKPAIVVIDLSGPHPVVRRRLESHLSVSNGPYDVFVNGTLVRALGIRPSYGIDSLALDSSGQFLYYAALNRGELYRISTDDLRFERNGLSDEQLESRVEHVASITMSDGIAVDDAGNVYISSLEHHAISRLSPSGELEVLSQDLRLRWPDGFGWSPDGDLYVTASALHQYMPELHKSEADIAKNASYQIYRMRPQLACTAGEICSGRVGH